MVFTFAYEIYSKPRIRREIKITSLYNDSPDLCSGNLVEFSFYYIRIKSNLSVRMCIKIHLSLK